MRYLTKQRAGSLKSLILLTVKTDKGKKKDSNHQYEEWNTISLPTCPNIYQVLYLRRIKFDTYLETPKV